MYLEVVQVGDSEAAYKVCPAIASSEDAVAVRSSQGISMTGCELLHSGSVSESPNDR